MFIGETLSENSIAPDDDVTGQPFAVGGMLYETAGKILFGDVVGALGRTGWARVFGLLGRRDEVGDLGKFAGQLVQGRVSGVRVTYSGTVTKQKTTAITMALAVNSHPQGPKGPDLERAR